MPSHFGVATIITACALLVIAGAGSAIAVLGAVKGHSTKISWGSIEFITQPAAPPPQTEPAKNWSERQKDAPPVKDVLQQIEQVDPVKKRDTQVAESPPKIESPLPAKEVAPIKKPKARIAKRDYGKVTVITPNQGDSAPDDYDRNSFVDNGVRYSVEDRICSKKRRSMYLQCYYPPQKPRPPVHNW